jgi:FkbM family methyltransferase
MRIRGHDSVADWLSAIVWSRRRLVTYADVRIDRRDPNIVGPVDAALYGGIYELPEITAVRTLTEPHDRVLEIGAGLGIVTTVAARAAEHVTAFEANPMLRPSLERTFALNEVDVDLRMQPVAEQRGEARIAVDDLFWTSRLRDEGLPVEAVAFSDLLEEISPTFLILDGEGIERELLADPLPGHVQKLVLELHPDEIGEAECEGIGERLAEGGFVRRDDLSVTNVLVAERRQVASSQ